MTCNTHPINHSRKGTNMTTELDQLRQEAELRRQAIASDVHLVSDRVDPTRIADRQKAKISQRVGSLRATVFGSSDSARSHSASMDNDQTSLKDRASGAVDSIKESTPDSVGDFTEGNPFAAGLIGVGLGLLAATLIPETREENRLAGKVQGKIDDVAAELAHAGQQLAETVKPAAQDAVESVKESASTSAKNVKDEASDASSDVAKTAEREAKGTAF